MRLLPILISGLARVDDFLKLEATVVVSEASAIDAADNEGPIRCSSLARQVRWIMGNEDKCHRGQQEMAWILSGS
jgi:hypothetical protein